MLSSLALGCLLAAAALAIVTTLLWAFRQRNKQRRARQKIGVLWLTQLRALLAHVQQHRGLSMGYVNGHTELLSQIRSLQQTIKHDISTIVAVDSWMLGNERWVNIQQHWERLPQYLTTTTPANNLMQHNQLIQSILYLFDDMAQAHELLLMQQQNESLHLSWRELLVAGECIGQARALGIATLAKAQCDSVTKIRFQYLCQKICDTTASSWRHMPPGDLQTSTVQKLLTCISKDIMQDKPSISVSEYFAVATQALDSLYLQYDAIVERLR